ncbi:MAG: AsmA-like C-terminal domain-containing protein [Rhodospirillaceae bacterium]|nr:AsmA-like C-terminal domain-containing protein [Rhodospirillaceae bacterium]
MVFSLAIGGTVIWRVRQGPVSIAQVLPILEDQVQTRTGLHVTAKNAFLAWDDMRHRLVIRLTQVAMSGAPGTVTRLPVVDLSYRLKALMHGAVLPTAAIVYRPRLVLSRDANGDVTVGVGSETLAPTTTSGTEPSFDLKATLAPLMAEGDRHLDFIAIVEAEATVIDIPRGRHYRVPRLDASLERTWNGLNAHAEFSSLIGGATSFFAIDATFDETSADVRATLSFQDVVPSLFADEFATLATVKGIALPISGKISARLSPQDITHIALTDLIHAEVRGEILGGSGTVFTSSPVNMPFPIKAFRIKGDYDGIAGHASVETLHLDLEDGALSASGTASWPTTGPDTAPTKDRITISTTVRLTDTGLSVMERYWPPSIAPPARDWMVENLKDGRVEDARFTAEAQGRDLESLDVTAFSGEAVVKDASVHFLRPLPPIVGAGGRATFGLKTIDVYPDGGHLGNLVVEPRGHIQFSGLDGEMQYAEIAANITGPIRDALELLDQDPLKLLHAMGTIDPKAISGSGKTHLSMRFPLLLDLRIKDMEVKATSSLTNVAIKNVIPRRSLSEGVLDLAVDLDSLEISGDGKVNGVPLRLGWEERFSGPGIRTRYTISGSVDDQGRAALGLDFIPFVAPYLRGPVIGDAVAGVDNQGHMSLGVQLDLTQAAMEVPGMGWRKLQGGNASGTASIRFDRGRLINIPQFRVQSGDSFEASGNAQADKTGRVQNLNLRDVRIGRSILEGGMAFAPDGSIDASFQGSTLDLQPLVGDGGWKALVDDNDTASSDQTVPPAVVHLNVGRAWVSENGQMDAVTGTLARGRDGKWIGNVNGSVDGGKKTAITVTRIDKGRHVSVVSEDAGALLTAFDFTQSIKSGAITLDATIPDGDGPITGLARIKTFNVVKAPIVARLVSVASITGIADLLSNTGVSFWYLEAPFSLNHGAVDLSEFRAAGPSFGVTANGSVNTDSRDVALNGTIIPVNVLNSLITDLPLIGPILGGKDGGLFAMNYTIKGTLDEPDVSVNPLSALVPGGVRSLFYPNDKKPDVQPAPPALGN